MKTIVILMSLSFSFFQSHAQTLWGTVSDDDENGTPGAVFKVNTDGSAPQMFPFPGSGTNNSDYYYSDPHHYRLIKASNGKIYGMTLMGGTSNEGTFFEFNPATGEVITKFDFYAYSDQGRAVGNLIEYDGKLYATINSFRSAILSFDPETGDYENVLTLPSSVGELMILNGKFYGMTRKGGTKWAGAIFEFDPQTRAYTVLFEFDHDQTGRQPTGALSYLDGKFYATTTSGGKYGHGTLIEYDLANHQFQKKIDFKSNVNGSAPIGDLTYYNGKFLGVTSTGGLYGQGVLFEYNQATSILVKLIDFNSPAQGRFFKNLDGDLYGVSTAGGANGKGSLFSFDPVTRQYTNLYEFNADATGTDPFGLLLRDGNKLWGMTMRGGAGNGGVIYEYDITANTYLRRHSFNYFPKGRGPMSLTQVGNKMYGIAPRGGAFNAGTLFQVDPESSEITVLHDFECSGCLITQYGVPEGKVFAKGYTLYGIIWKGGAQENAELFEFNVNTSTYRKLYDFKIPLRGVAPLGDLAIVGDKIYGSTALGGYNDQGTLWMFDLPTSTYHYRMTLQNNYTGRMLRLANVNNVIVGQSMGGPFSKGVISMYDPVNYMFSPKYNFQNPADGVRPVGALVTDGYKAYGYTNYESGYNGKIYEFDPETQLYNVISDIPGSPYLEEASTLHGNTMYIAAAFWSGSVVKFNVQTKTLEEFYLDLDVTGYYKKITSLTIQNEVYCTSESMVREVVEYNPGKRKDGDFMSGDRTAPENALYDADANDSPNGGIKFTSLGFGGSITLAFDHLICNNNGNDFRVFETSYSNPSFYDCPEQAEVFVSQDGVTWSSLGLTSAAGCHTKLDTDFDIEVSGLSWIQYVKVVDVTNPNAKRKNASTCADYGGAAFNNAADGFDLDAIELLPPLPPDYMAARQSQQLVSREVDIDGEHSKALLFPNPVSGQLRIDLAQEEEMVIAENEMILEIVDIHGRVLQRTTDAMDENWVITQDTSKLTSGLYFARVKSGGVRRHYKFIKN